MRSEPLVPLTVRSELGVSLTVSTTRFLSVHSHAERNLVLVRLPKSRDVRDVPASMVRAAAAALSVPRAPLVLRQLSALRRELKVGEITRAAAALGVLEVVATEGLRPAEETDQQPPVVLTPDRVRLICYQVVHR